MNNASLDLEATEKAESGGVLKRSASMGASPVPGPLSRGVAPLFRRPGPAVDDRGVVFIAACWAAGVRQAAWSPGASCY